MKKRGVSKLRASRRTGRSSRNLERKITSRKKFGLVISNLILSAVLTLISWLFYAITTNEVLKNFFWMLGLIFGFVGLAFFIILLILLVMKTIKK